MLANRYATLFADSLSMASFYTESMDVDSHDDSKVIDVEALRDQYIEDKTNENIDMVTHPLMRRFCNSEYCDANRYVEMAKVAAVSCMHHDVMTSWLCRGERRTQVLSFLIAFGPCYYLI